MISIAPSPASFCGPAPWQDAHKADIVVKLGREINFEIRFGCDVDLTIALATALALALDLTTIDDTQIEL